MRAGRVASQRCPVLLFCPAVPLWRHAGGLLLDRKFHDGFQSYRRLWPGRTRLAMRVIDVDDWPSFGAVRVADAPADFDLIVLSDHGSVVREHLEGVDVVLASADAHRNLDIAHLCLEHGVPCIHDIEYTLRTRFQMVRAEQSHWWARSRSLAWLALNEFRLRRALGAATSIQANGLPAYRRYAQGKPGSMVYFDNRMTTANCVTDAALEERLGRLASGAPLQLAFSGRLIRAKGADDLVSVARHLRVFGTRFELHIFGTGELEPQLRAAIAADALDGQVRLHGAVDFESDLLPFIRCNIDVFVCCHRQGDPSCTYLETYGCGVPIAGYANEAHRSMIGHRDVGWQVPMGDARGLAELIFRLDTARDQIARKSRTALAFARDNLSDRIFAQRMAHCLAITFPVESTEGAVAA